VIGFNGVIRILLGEVARGGYQLVDHSRVGRCSVGGDLDRARAVLEGAGEEPASGRQIPLLCEEDVDDLAVLVDRPVQIDQYGDLDIRLIDEPAIAGCMPAGSGCVDQQRGEALYPTGR
jgi:hypothetical protein